eukprot:COSAG01_NODE_8681_length_2697_cov_179.687837_2_plen_126_part_00
MVAPTLPMLLAVIAALMGVESGAAGAGGRAGAGGGIVWVLSRQISWREPARLDAAVLMGSATPDSRRCVRTGCNRYQLPPVAPTLARSQRHNLANHDKLAPLSLRSLWSKNSWVCVLQFTSASPM